MKAPDKLYINKYMIRPGMLHPAEFPPDNPEWEYIRKDALLEWAKEQLDILNKQTLLHPDDEVFWGQRNAFKQLIDKLNKI